MFIKLSNASNKPIYEQITEQIKQLILNGELAQGAALPSIRLLAKELKISVMTTKRAYTDLEQEGFIETIAGKGSFVATRNHDFLREALVRKIEGHFVEAIQLAQMANMERSQLVALLELLYEEEKQ